MVSQCLSVQEKPIAHWYWQRFQE